MTVGLVAVPMLYVAVLPGWTNPCMGLHSSVSVITPCCPARAERDEEGEYACTYRHVQPCQVWAQPAPIIMPCAQVGSSCGQAAAASKVGCSRSTLCVSNQHRRLACGSVIQECCVPALSVRWLMPGKRSAASARRARSRPRREKIRLQPSCGGAVLEQRLAARLAQAGGHEGTAHAATLHHPYPSASCSEEMGNRLHAGGRACW